MQKGNFSNNAEKLVGKLHASMSYTTVEDILKEGLHEFLNEIQIKLNQIDHEIYSVYFNPEIVLA